MSERSALLATAIFALAKAAAEYGSLPAVTEQTGYVNAEYSGELLQIMQDSARLIAALLLWEEESQWA
jgi:hypothetical protein